MADETIPERLDEAVAACMAEAQGGDAKRAVVVLLLLLQQEGYRISDRDLYALARLDAYADDPEVGSIAVDAREVHSAAEQVMRQRGLWLRFRCRVWIEWLLQAGKWVAALLGIGVMLLALVALTVILLTHIATWLGW